jgi:hypothetical protein
MREEVASAEKVVPGVYKVCLVATHTVRPKPPTTFIDVLIGWGHTWIWDNLKVIGETDWIAQAIAEGTLVAVTDGLYTREHCPQLCAAAFMLKCTKNRGQMAGSFPEASAAANAFQGKLLGLMAIHLVH